LLCDKCKERKAEVFLTKILNGHKEEFHLCNQCAQGEKGFFSLDAFTFQDLLTSLIDQSEIYSPNSKKQIEIRCSNCGLTYDVFKQAGRLGCSNCYKTFKPLLGSFLQRIHGSEKHTGKVFGEKNQLSKVKLEIKSLQKQLQKAVELENYEEAAEIRDAIKKMENQGGGQN